MRPLRLLPRILAATTLLALSAVPVLAAETSVEAGAYLDYVAPDAGVPSTGSITFGLQGTPETIAADAVISAEAAAWLPNLGGGVPTCISVTRDAGVITALSFEAECSLAGTLTLVPDVFGPGVDAYALSDRVITPVYQVEDQTSPDFNPGYNALMGTAFDAGSVIDITFAIDLNTGIPQTMSGSTEIAGAVVVQPNGDISVGAATLLDEVLDAPTRAALEAAADAGVEATVTIAGSGAIDISGGPVVISLSFTVTADPAPTPTPTPSASVEAGTPAPSASSAPVLLPDTTMSPGKDTTAVVLLGVALIAALAGVVGLAMSRFGGRDL